MVGPGVAEQIERLAKRAGAVEVLQQAAAPLRRQVERIDQAGEQAAVADRDVGMGHAELGGRLAAQRQHLGVGRLAVAPAERFDAGLQELARRVAAVAEHRAEIAVADRLGQPARGDVVAAHRNGEVGPEAPVAPAGVGGEVDAPAHVLAGEVEEHVGRLQNGRRHVAVAGALELGEQSLSPASRRQMPLWSDRPCLSFAPFAALLAKPGDGRDGASGLTMNGSAGRR